MKRLFISSLGITLFAAGSAVAQYAYKSPAADGAAFFPRTSAVVMLTPAEALAQLRARIPAAAGLPGEQPIRFRTAALNKAVSCGTITVLYPNGIDSQLAGASVPAAEASAEFMAWRPDGRHVMAEATTGVEADATLWVEPENGGSAARITVDVAYRVTRSLTLDGVAQPPVTVAFSSASLGEAPAMTPHAAMHPVGFGVTPTGNATNATPIPRLACIASGVLEKALLLEEPTLTAEQGCMLGLPSASGPACPGAVAQAGTAATLSDASAAPAGASGASRPPR